LTDDGAKNVSEAIFPDSILLQPNASLLISRM